MCKDTRRGRKQEVPRGHERKEMIDGVAHAIDAVIDLEKKNMSTTTNSTSNTQVNLLAASLMISVEGGRYTAKS